MKLLAIGDIHGRGCWEQIVKKNIDHVDKIIFVGDYFDSFKIPFEAQVLNFGMIMGTKARYGDKIVLLLGNHDYHYIDEEESYSGYQDGEKAKFIGERFKEWNKHFQVCFIQDEWLFSHAGVSEEWLKRFPELKSVEDINESWENYDRKKFGFNIPEVAKMSLRYSGYGDNVWQGPMWIRPNSLANNRIDGFYQVVGHTWNKEAEIKIAQDRVFFIDCLTDDGRGEYIIIDTEDNSWEIYKL